MSGAAAGIGSAVSISTAANSPNSLQVYSDRVSRGEWRDYAIDHTAGGAMFSVFRHSQDRPVYAIAKTAGPRGHEYAVFDGRCKLARTPSLSEALAVFDTRIRLVDD